MQVGLMGRMQIGLTDRGHILPPLVQTNYLIRWGVSIGMLWLELYIDVDSPLRGSIKEKGFLTVEAFLYYQQSVSLGNCHAHCLVQLAYWSALFEGYGLLYLRGRPSAAHSSQRDDLLRGKSSCGCVFPNPFLYFFKTTGCI